MVEGREHLKLVGAERDVWCGAAADDRCASDVRVEKIMRPLFASCGRIETVEESRRKLYVDRAASLPVADKAGDYL